MATLPSSADVLIVGAGPTGLTLACELARRGVDCVVIDKAAGPSTVTKASAVTPRTLEIFEAIGVIDEALRLGVKVHGIAFHAEGKRIVHASFDELDAPYPFTLNLGQVLTERILGKLLSDLGKSVRWQAELISFEEGGNEVVAKVSAGGAAHELGAQYLVGCDGAHSTVRRKLGLELKGKTYPEDSIIGDMYVDWDWPRDEVCFQFSRDGALTVTPLPEGRWQVWGNLPILPDGRSRTQAGQSPTLKDMQAVFDRRTSIPGKLREPTWLTYFATHQRKTDHRRSGRVLIAGDASHISSPNGGLGMNTGIQDATNLGWKLAPAVRGQASEELLASYEIEREMAIKPLFQISDMNQRLFTLRNPVAQEIRNHIMGVAMGFDAFWARTRRTATQEDWNYRRSPVVGEYAGLPLHLPAAQHLSDHGSCVAAWSYFGSGPHAGDHTLDCDSLTTPDGRPSRLFAELDSAKHNLLLFLGCDEPEPEVISNFEEIARWVREKYADRIAVHYVMPADLNNRSLDLCADILLDHKRLAHDRYGARGQCLYLLRPDGYVGFRSQPPMRDKLAEHLRRIFRSGA